MKSILQQEKYCYVCGTTNNLNDHHVYFGAKRNISEVNGFKVWLCVPHHTDNRIGVHNDRELDLMLKRQCQFAYECNHTREEFTKLIGRNYLQGEEENE